MKPRTSSHNLKNKASSSDINDEVNDNEDDIRETSADEDNNDNALANEQQGNERLRNIKKHPCLENQVSGDCLLYTSRCV